MKKVENYRGIDIFQNPKTFQFSSQQDKLVCCWSMISDVRSCIDALVDRKIQPVEIERIYINVLGNERKERASIVGVANLEGVKHPVFILKSNNEHKGISQFSAMGNWKEDGFYVYNKDNEALYTQIELLSQKIQETQKYLESLQEEKRETEAKLVKIPIHKIEL